MASFREHRSHTRLQCRVPLELQRPAHTDEKPYGAMVYNTCEDGVYLETNREIEPGEQVRIHPLQLVPRVVESSLCDSTGIIRWSRPVDIGRHRLYGAGVRLSLPCGREERLKGRPGVLYFCDMCGETIGLWDVRRQRGDVWLCEHCRRHLSEFPDAVYRVVTRYLIGNVL